MDNQTKKCCGTCRYGIKVGGGAVPKFVGCHRFPPAAEFASPFAHYGASKFPLLDPDAFCWEWSTKVEGDKLPEGNFLIELYD